MKKTKEQNEGEAALTGVESVPAAVQAESAPVQEPAKAEEPRVREKGIAIKCPECGGDSFSVGTRTHPNFIERRIRRYKCGACGCNFKQLV